ncbi:MAG: hypothetical protein LLG04_11795 [Parachlamydia sp.]|nr:hypothetical protein [Parachlamydia sp.]
MDADIRSSPEAPRLIEQVTRNTSSLSKGINDTTKGFKSATTAYQSVNDFRRIQKSVRKIITSKIFPETSRIVRFIESHAIIGRIYFVSQALALVGFTLKVPKLWRATQGVVKNQGIKRLDSVSKVCSNVGKMINAFTITIAGLEAFKLGSKLGQWGLKSASAAFNASVGIADLLGIIGTLLAGASMVHKSIILRNTHRTQNELKEHKWYRQDGRYTPNEYQLFRLYCQAMDDKESKKLGKYMRVEGEALKKALIAITQPEAPTQANLQKMRQCVDNMVGRLQTRKRIYVITIITRVVNLATMAAIFIPPLNPLAAVLIGATAVSKVATLLYDNIHRYRFENRLEMIDRRGQPKPITWRANLIDYSKWQIGWYEKASLISRLFNSSSLVGSGLAQNTAALSNILGAVEAVASIIK